MDKTRRESTLARFWDKVCVGYGGGCWIWLAYLRNGYGLFNAGGPKYAHRLAYEWLRGPIPSGMQIHHKCMNKACVNPGHMELVTLVENVLKPDGGPALNAAKTHCPHGHEYTPENTRWMRGRRGRQCRECHRIRSRCR